MGREPEEKEGETKMSDNERLFPIAHSLSGHVSRAIVIALFGAVVYLPAPSWAQDSDVIASPSTPDADSASSQEESSEEDDEVPEKEEAVPSAQAPGEKEEEKKGKPTMSPTLGSDATPEQRAALEEYEKAFSRYRGEANDYKRSVDSIVESKYRQRVSAIQNKYNSKIDELTETERERRIDAIAAFESFVQRYPRRPKYTPDALFRLAELQFEKANDDFLLADERFQEQLALYDRGKIQEPPSDPIRDYTPTIQTFERLIQDWPEYRFLDGAYYLLAYSKLQMGEEEQAKDIFLSLVIERPESEFVPEAWVRVGEYFFDNNDLISARDSYKKALEYTESRFYDKALYKLAWTHYREDDFDAAIGRFKQLVEYSDAEMERTGQSGSVLRAEAIQYAAISLAENDWDADAITDDDFGLERTKKYLPGTQPYERELLAQLVEYLFEANYFDHSVEIARYALNAFPNAAENPQLHEQLVLAMFRNEQLEAAFDERRQLGEFYGPGSNWYEVQREEGNVDAMRYASNLVRDNLIQSATWFHEQAQNQRDEAIVQQDDAMLESAKRQYALAAKTYREFLQKHPNDKDSFRWNYYLAETLFYSEQFEEAFEQYQAVREMDLRDDEFYKVQETVAFNAVKALESVIKLKVESGEIPAKTLPGGAKDAVEQVASSEAANPDEEGADIVAEPLPGLARKYVTAMDRYVVLGLENPEDPNLDAKFAFQAAKLFYDYNDFPRSA